MPAEKSLTAEVARFIVEYATRRIPGDVMHLGKRSILDGIGLALAGNAAESGRIVRTYLEDAGLAGERGCTVIGTSLKLPARFAAFANGIAIHADDYDDTQLAVAKDRVYGLLTHPTAPALPPRSRSASATTAPASTCWPHIRSPSKSKPKLRKRSTRGTTTMASIRRRRWARSPRPRQPRA